MVRFSLILIFCFIAFPSYACFFGSSTNTNLVIVRCPSLKSYTKAEQLQILSELEQLEKQNLNIIPSALADYDRLRKACRVR